MIRWARRRIANPPWSPMPTVEAQMWLRRCCQPFERQAKHNTEDIVVLGVVVIICCRVRSARVHTPPPLLSESAIFSHSGTLSARLASAAHISYYVPTAMLHTLRLPWADLHIPWILQLRITDLPKVFLSGNLCVKVWSVFEILCILSKKIILQQEKRKSIDKNRMMY